MKPNPRFFPHLFSLALCLAAAGPAALRAEVVPNPLFSDNAVLQQGMPVPVWGRRRTGRR